MALTVILVAVVVALQGINGVYSSPTTHQEPLPHLWPCPIPFNILPCVCKAKEDYNLTLDCSEVRTTSQLEGIFMETFPFDIFLELKIAHNPDDLTNQLDIINAQTFQDISFERIIITGTQLSTIADEAFSKSHGYLRHLDLSNNQLQAFPFESLPDYLYLHTFILDDNHFDILPDLESGSLEVFSANRIHNMKVESTTQFKNCPMLRELYLSKISLLDLGPGMFTDLMYLEVIDLSDNHLTALEEGVLTTKNHTLTSVILDQNNIRYVRHDAIIGLDGSGKLSMDHNNVTELDQPNWQHILDQLYQDASLNLAENPLTCGCDIAWIMLDDDDKYRLLITDTSLCQSTIPLIDLDQAFFVEQC